MKCHHGLLYESHSQMEWKKCWSKRKLFIRVTRKAVCLRLLRLYGCAVILNWFLVALLFHYLIGKRVYTLRWVSTPLSGTEWGIFHDITHSEWSCVIIYYWYYVFLFFLQYLSCGALTASTWNSLAGGTGRVIVWGCLQLMFSTLSLTLYIFF